MAIWGLTYMTEAILESASYAAHQSDRWLFVALLTIGLCAISVLFKYFTGRLDNLQSRMDRQTQEFVTHLQDASREMISVIASATSAIERIEKHLE
jgi:hypothetical protein